MVQHSLNFLLFRKKKESIKLCNTDPEDFCDGKKLEEKQRRRCGPKKTGLTFFGSRDKNSGFSAVFP